MINTTLKGKRMFSSAMSGKSVVIVAAKRTPIGGFMGQFKSMPASQLGSAAAVGAIQTAGIQPTDIEEAFMGCVITAGQG